MRVIINMKKAVDRIVECDPMLASYRDELRLRVKRRNDAMRRIGKDLTEFANGYLYYGFHRTNDGWVFREWLPGADKVYLTGDFNGWDRSSHPLTRLENGVWEIALPGRDALRHGQYIKLWVVRDGAGFERIPAYIRWTDLDTVTARLCGRIFEPDEPYAWKNTSPRPRAGQRLIYEAHAGMAQEKEGIGSYREFADTVLPRVKELGYNTVQLMAIQEHPYYASFGYQVSSFFAPAHRSGTPDDLRYLIDTAHGLGLDVMLDVVHSHACANRAEGLDRQDGTDGQYFLEGPRGTHPAWGTRLFDYGKTEVLHFLLSNLKYWQTEFRFDGFRFDGVTSMAFEDHALGTSFTGYGQYFGYNTNLDALAYLMLANELVHKVDPRAVTVAEDMSGTPGMCLPVTSAGIGFDYRLNMGLPDYWIKTVKERPFGSWDMGGLWNEVTLLRPGEKSVSYCESHDQALVGDKTLIFRMAGAEMYTAMRRDSGSLVIDNAVDMHKLIRFLSLVTGGGGYLNFMGNEFGHPEWIDFPRDGNGWSYRYARRQWSLAEDDTLRYGLLQAFDRGMLSFVNERALLTEKQAVNLWIDQEEQILAFSRGKALFVFNFHPDRSQTDFFLPAHTLGRGAYRVVFTSDDAAYGGRDRVRKDYIYHTKMTKKGRGFMIYVPCRTAVVLEKVPRGRK